MAQAVMVVSEAKPLQKWDGETRVLLDHQSKNSIVPSSGKIGSRHQERTSCQVMREKIYPAMMW